MDKMAQKSLTKDRPVVIGPLLQSVVDFWLNKYEKKKEKEKETSC